MLINICHLVLISLAAVDRDDFLKNAEERFYEGEPINREALKRQEQVEDPWSRQDIPLEEAQEAREMKALLKKQKIIPQKH